jgi:hypothetical protein
MFLSDNSISDIGNSIGVIGVAIFLIGIVALIGAIYLVNIGFQTKEANGQGNPVLSTIFQIIGGAIGLIIVNSPVLFIINHPNRICVDKDDIACGMVLLIGLLFAILLINSIAVIVIIILINRKKWGIAAGALSIISLAAIIVGGFLTRQLWIK